MSQALYITDLIKRNGPRRFVEIGTGVGLSTGIIAMAMDDDSGGELVAVDANTKFYGDLSKSVGFLIPKIYAGSKTTIRQITGISFDLATPSQPLFDMAFIDGSRHHPWPTLDTAAVLPLMKPNSIIIHRDLSLYQSQTDARGVGPKYLFDQIDPSHKYVMPTDIPNMFYIVAGDAAVNFKTPIRNALLLPWTPGIDFPPPRLRACPERY